MKRLKRKSGFTLVECVVAMALLAIMSLLLTMLLNITINQRNQNITRERELDEQVGKIVEGDVAEQGIGKEIVFKQGAEEIEKIPGNGVDGIDANKIYNDDHDSEVDALEYDFSGYTKFDSISGGATPGGSPEEQGSSNKLYGAVDIVKSNGKSPITLTETVSDNSDGTKSIKLNVKFNVASIYMSSQGEAPGESALKVVLPISVKSVSSQAVMNSKVLPISKNSVRIVPSNTGYVEVNITFTLTAKDYTETYKDVSYYFTGVSSAGNSIIAYMNE